MTTLFTKTCKKCKEYLPFDSFHADSRTDDGLQHWCKTCRKQWRDNLPYQRQKEQRCRDRENAEHRKGRVATCRKCGQPYTGDACKPCVALYMREWNEKNRDRIREQRAQKRQQNKQDDPTFMQRARERGNKHRLLLKLEVFERLGNKCYCCGLDDIRFLTVEHLNNDGAKHKHPGGKRLAGVWVYRWIKDNNYPPDIVLACYNCNMARQHAGKGHLCPHRLDRQQPAA